MSDVEERVRKIIAEQFGLKPEELRDDMTFAEDLMAESVDIVELIAALEDEFGIEIPEEEAQQNKTVGEAIEYMKKKLAAS
ncbi:MAG: acyl carrier protein [Thaumarchaeota archaeon]|nr:MAG: acyl carrier protein [Candidatus Wolframiiraptor sp.]RLG06755.1 MAG: acyl carrier protein [Nitrososphaerota archaeon]HDD39808.1 acyl carrier protein [Nitrososphaeria archaeon]